MLHLAPDDPEGAEHVGRGVSGHFSPREFLPGPVCRSFDELAPALDAVFDPMDDERRIVYQRAVEQAFAHTDDLSSWRLVELMRRQYVDA